MLATHMHLTHNRSVKILPARPFRIALDALKTKAVAGDERAEATLRLVAAQVAVLRDLDGEPVEETATVRRVVQSGAYPIWRLSHPFREGLAVRTIVWFTPEGEAVLMLFFSDKAQMGDVFYDSVASRADQAIGEWLRDRPTSQKEDER